MLLVAPANHSYDQQVSRAETAEDSAVVPLFEVSPHKTVKRTLRILQVLPKIPAVTPY